MLLVVIIALAFLCAVEATLILYESWRYMETDTSKNAATNNQTFKSFKFKLHDKLCRGVFPLYYENKYDLLFCKIAINDT